MLVGASSGGRKTEVAAMCECRARSRSAMRGERLAGAVSQRRRCSSRPKPCALRLFGCHQPRRKFVPGCYALSVSAELPQHIEDILDNRGIKWRLPD